MTHGVRTGLLVAFAAAVIAFALWQAGVFSSSGSGDRSEGPAEEGATPEAIGDAAGLRGAPAPRPVDADADAKEVDGEPVGVLVLRLGEASVKGVVTGAGAPLLHARVSPVLAAPDDGRAVRTSKDGRFEIRGLPAGEIDLRVSAEGFVPRTARTPVLVVGTTADAGEVALRARPAQEDGIEVKVVDAAGRPVAGAKVALSTLTYGIFLTLGSQSGLRDAKSAEGVTDERGVARFFPLATEKYDVVVRAEGFALAVAENVVAALGRVEHVIVRVSPALTISGSVVDEKGGPVAGAQVVTLAQPTFKIYEATETTSDGSFTLTGLDAGAYWIMAFHDEKGEGQNQGSKAGDRGVRVQLRGVGRLVGKVVDAAEKAVPSFVLRPFRPEPFQYVYSRTYAFKDVEGRFSLPLPAGAYQVDVKAEGGAFRPGTPVTLQAGETRELTIRLPEGGVVKGAVTDPDGNHVPDVEVFVSKGGFPPSPVPELYARTGADGAFRIAGFPLEPVKLVVRHKAYATRLVEATPAPESSAKEVTVRLSAGARVEGHVKTGAGAPLTGEQVTLSHGFDFLDARTAFTDATGSFAFRGVAKDRYQLTLGKFENLASGQQKTVDAPESGTVVVDFQKEGAGGTGGTVTGRVTMKGAPVAGATVVATDARGVEQSVTVKTDEDGRYAASGLEPGRVSIYVETPGGFTTSERVRLEAAGGSAVQDVEFGTASIRGLLVAEGTGAPVSAAWVTIEVVAEGLTGWERVRGQVTSDPKGLFTAGGLEPGTYRIRAQGTGLAARTTDPFPVAEGETKDVGTIRLQTGAGITGRVTDDLGKPVHAAGVSMLDTSGKPVFLFSMVSTGTDGRYEVQGLELGTYVVRFEAKGYAPAEKTAAVTSGGIVVDAVVARGGAISAAVSDDAGRPVEGARIELVDGQGRKVAKTLSIVNLFDADVSRTDAQGRATIPDLAPGSYTVKVVKDGMTQSGDAPVVTVPPGGSGNASLTLRAGP